MTCREISHALTCGEAFGGRIGGGSFSNRIAGRMRLMMEEAEPFGLRLPTPGAVIGYRPM